jgi:hypothetical protein
MRGVWTVLATGFTLAVIGLSMAMNFIFGHALGTSPANARILGTLSVACDGLKAFLPLFIAWQWADGHRLAAAAGALLFALLLAYGTASAIGFAAENRAALTGTRDNRNSLLEDATAQLAAMQARLAALPAHRLQGVVEADIAAARKDRAWDATQGCTQATRIESREFCKRIDLLKGELAVAAEDTALAATIDRLQAQVRQAKEAGAGNESDPQARAITQFTGLDTASVRSGFAWLLAIAVEAISAFGLFAITRREAARPAKAQRHAHSHRQWRLAARISEAGQTRGWRLLKTG